MRSVSRRHRRLSEEISEPDEQLDRLVAEAAPGLVAMEGVGTDTAASPLIAAGERQSRAAQERGVFQRAPVRGRTDPGIFWQERAPSPRPSRQPRGQSTVLYVIALCRMSRDERTHAYVARRTTEGKTKK